jgi:hypothetical protein
MVGFHDIQRLNARADEQIPPLQSRPSRMSLNRRIAKKGVAVKDLKQIAVGDQIVCTAGKGLIKFCLKL